MIAHRLFTFMTKLGVMIAFLLIISLSYFYIDRPLATLLASFNFATELRWLWWLTAVGTGLIYMLVFFLTALFFRYVKVNAVYEARSWFLWLCVVCCSTITGILKVVLGRARPDLWIQAKIYGFYGFQTARPFMSFPSGHTTTVMSVAIGLSVLFPRHWLLFFATGFLVALSRVLLLQHYLSDVLAAAYLVIIEIGLLRYLLQKKGWLQCAWIAVEKPQEGMRMQVNHG